MKFVAALALILLLGAAGLSTAGVWLLAGFAWSLICGAAWAFVAGCILVRGAMTDG
ncbi:hypothetical protein JI664_12695 [Rhodobacter sp. NTK016B]|uniref:hypothetical protein n=1 Tax=Rhodobacter sp. NTK016B TaxID=2759676 RepID=UPI001A8F5F46|nr:hypothetical protein [Rhodobacter sp. NTK016B]MBN8292825.1 hypothetical protein [Rhodobacter sp. NTK016B]